MKKGKIKINKTEFEKQCISATIILPKSLHYTTSCLEELYCINNLKLNFLRKN